MKNNELERKKQIDQMASKIFDYICTACDEKEAEKRFMELSLSFMTSTIDVEQPMMEIINDINTKTTKMSLKASSELFKVKKGNSEKLLSEFLKEKK